MLAQIAIQQGKIGSWEDKVRDYLPEIQGPFADELKLRHLSTMTAGLQWDENYTQPFDITAQAYYGPDIRQLMFDRVPVVTQPGRTFEYQSGAPQLLSMVVNKATGKSLSAYASEVLWKPLGARFDARWHLDSKDGTELAYCCFNSNARDFARFGKMLLHYGKWNNTTILDSAFVYHASKASSSEYYGWSFWVLDDLHTPVYYMRGILGQYVIVMPEKGLVVCRLGKSRLPTEKNHPGDLRIIAGEVLKYYAY